MYTLQAIVAATNTCLIEQPTGDRHAVYTRGDSRGNHRRDSHPVCALQAIVAAMNTCLIEQPTDDCRGDDRV